MIRRMNPAWWTLSIALLSVVRLAVDPKKTISITAPVLISLGIGVVAGLLVTVFWWKRFNEIDLAKCHFYARLASIASLMTLLSFIFIQVVSPFYALLTFMLVITIGILVLRNRFHHEVNFKNLFI